MTSNIIIDEAKWKNERKELKAEDWERRLEKIIEMVGQRDENRGKMSFLNGRWSTENQEKEKRRESDG